MSKDFQDIHDKLLKKYPSNFINCLPDTNLEKISNFYSYVVPSFLSISLPENQSKWRCMFFYCRGMNVRNFSSKQTLVRHLVCKHGHELPDHGSFLSPNSDYFKPITCDICDCIYKRRDHYNNHLEKCQLSIENSRPLFNQHQGLHNYC